MKQNAEVGLFAKPSKMKWVSRLSISALMFLFLCLSGCTAIKATVHLLRSTDHLVPLEADGRVLYEPGAEEFARRMAELLPDAVRQVEAGHYRPFAKEVRIRVCVSEESFHDLTGMDVKALLTLKGVFFSPRVLKEPENLPSYLAHELSHLHLEQQIGKLKYAKLPAWFKEGLATLVSEGGGANKVTESEAVEAFKAGRHFKPHAAAGFVFPTYASHWGLSPHMFYRQSMMFVAYLKARDETRYHDLLRSLQDGLPFADAFTGAFDAGLDDMWEDFINGIKDV